VLCPSHEALSREATISLIFMSHSSPIPASSGRPGLPPVARPAGPSARALSVFSDDGRFVASLDGDSAVFWTSTGLFSSEAFVLPCPVLDARFIKRRTVTYLETIATDGAVRDWFVFEDFADKPTWAVDIAQLNYGTVIDDDGNERTNPGYLTPAHRAALHRALRESSSPAARALRRHLMLEP
jgi:hypothetical protein